ncbi:MAG: hypothetical protein WBD80_19880, partial [Xanthobacteraceae bacterium]
MAATDGAKDVGCPEAADKVACAGGTAAIAAAHDAERGGDRPASTVPATGLLCAAAFCIATGTTAGCGSAPGWLGEEAAATESRCGLKEHP